MSLGEVELPPHELNVLAPKRGRYAVLIPVWNEGDRLLCQLDTMRTVADPNHDVVIADARSTDGSTAPDRLASLGVSALLSIDGRGASTALRAALRFALVNGYEGVILMDGNGKDDSSMIRAFTAALDAGADYAQGSRYLPGGGGINTPVSRDLLIRYVHSPFFSVLAGRRFTDSTIGSRAFSSRFLLDPRVRPFRHEFQFYDLYFYLAWAACRLGFRVTDVAVTRRYPAHGPIPTKITGIRGRWRMIRPLFMLLLRRY